VRTLSDAGERLEAAVLAAGWRALPPGDAWYAERFAWQLAPAEPGPELVQPVHAGGLPPPLGRAPEPAGRPEATEPYDATRSCPQGIAARRRHQ